MFSKTLNCIDQRLKFIVEFCGLSRHDIISSCVQKYIVNGGVELKENRFQLCKICCFTTRKTVGDNAWEFNISNDRVTSYANFKRSINTAFVIDLFWMRGKTG